MIGTELKHKIELFNIERERFKSDFEHFDELQRSYVSDFSIETIRKMKLDDYVVGKGSRSSFCNRLERELAEIGRMSGSPSPKFVVYYGRNGKETEPKYRYTKKLGKVTNEFEALEKVKCEIIALINAGADNNRREILDNRLSDLFKYKILGTYYPEKHLNLYSQRHLDFFLGELGLNINEVSVLGKQDTLLDFKNSDLTMQQWSNYEFNYFLYRKIGYPPSNDKEMMEKGVLPSIEKVKPELIKVEIDNSSPTTTSTYKGSAKPDYKAIQESNTKLGLRGEYIVFNWEKKQLERNNQALEELIHASENDDRLGYDIQSLDFDGKIKYIEVKSTRKKKRDASFFITANEIEKAKSLENYYIYVVFEAHTLHPKIWQIREPFKIHKDELNLVPVNYRVEISIIK